jgi:hypothetical protein
MDQAFSSADIESAKYPGGGKPMGLIGAPLLLASDTAIMFGLSEQFSLSAGIATLSVA